MRGINGICYLCGREIERGNYFDASGLAVHKKCPYDWQKAKAMADRLRRATVRYENRNMKWAEDREDARMIRADVKKLNKLAYWIENGEFEKAIHTMGLLDTAVRDEIPVTVYNFVFNVPVTVG
jgi:hypothetical protein